MNAGISHDHMLLPILSLYMHPIHFFPENILPDSSFCCHVLQAHTNIHWDSHVVSESPDFDHAPPPGVPIITSISFIPVHALYKVQVHFELIRSGISSTSLPLLDWVPWKATRLIDDPFLILSLKLLAYHWTIRLLSISLSLLTILFFGSFFPCP